MSDLFELWEKPTAKEINMLVGWRQWADAGSISSSLPEYFIEALDARKIGEIKPHGYYIFQAPGTHHLFRPVIKIEDGRRQHIEKKQNEIFYAESGDQGFVIFLGDEPHYNVEQYADAFFAVLKELNIRRVVGVAGVYGPTPYNKDRQISCIYSLAEMREEMEQYAVNFSNYEGGASIGSVLVDRAENEELEFIEFYGFVPAYDFSQSNQSMMQQGISIENDFKAWYDISQRLKHMFKLDMDLAELYEQSEEMILALDDKIEEIIEKMPQLNIRDYMDKLQTEFNELSFVPLDDVWEQGLADIFGDE